MEKKYSVVTKAYYMSLKVVSFLQKAILIPFEIFWLGLMDRRALYDVDKYYYDINPFYQNDEYINQGFFEWEEKAVREHFGECGEILVAGAGAGREMLALLKTDFRVSGFECNAHLAEIANRTFLQKGYNAKVAISERDGAPDTEEIYDGIMVGWAVYMHICESEKRIEFLKKIRQNIADGGPLLISFFTKKGNPEIYRIIASSGNVIRRLLGRKKIEAGDRLAPNFIHYFSIGEIEKELQAGGFELMEFSAKQYGYAVARAK